MDESVSIALPHGLWIGSLRHGVVKLRTTEAEDEKFLLESSGIPPVARANGLLARCISLPEELQSPSESVVRALIIGDREALLLHLLRMNFGDEFVATFSCTSPACTETLELDFQVSDLLLPSYADAAPSYNCKIRHGDVTHDVQFRLPTAGDQEEIATMARLDADQAARRLLYRCVEKVVVEGGEGDVTELAEPVIDEIAAAMAELDPQAVIEFTLTCPGCGITNQVLFDATNFLLRKLDQRVDRAIREVHTLALWYHWSEEAILNMPADRRQKYLDLIAAGGEFAS